MFKIKVNISFYREIKEEKVKDEGKGSDECMSENSSCHNTKEKEEKKMNSDVEIWIGDDFPDPKEKNEKENDKLLNEDEEEAIKFLGKHKRGRDLETLETKRGRGRPRRHKKGHKKSKSSDLPKLQKFEGKKEEIYLEKSTLIISKSKLSEEYRKQRKKREKREDYFDTKKSKKSKKKKKVETKERIISIKLNELENDTKKKKKYSNSKGSSKQKKKDNSEESEADLHNTMGENNNLPKDADTNNDTLTLEMPSPSQQDSFINNINRKKDNIIMQTQQLERRKVCFSIY